MSKTRALGFLGSLTFVVALFVVLPGMGADEKQKDGRGGLYRPLGLFTEVLSLVRSNYVEPVEVKPLLTGAFAGMTEAMDPFSEYVPPEKMAAFNAALAAREKKEALDVGVVLARKFGYPVVICAVAGGPAAAGGVKSDDIVEKIDEKPVRGLGLWEAEARLSGKAGTKVRLLIVREGKPRRRTLEVVRGSWTPEMPAASRVEGETVVRVPSFTPGTAEALKAVVSKFDRTKPLLLDVRGNALGSFEEAARAAALFVAPGPLGELKGRKIAGKSFTAVAGERVHESQLVVLVDSGTGGAAELFAASLREAGFASIGEKTAAPKPAGEEEEVPPEEPQPQSPHGAPPKKRLGPIRLVGEMTSGMGFVAQTVKLATGGSLKLSVGKVRTVSGRALSPKGVDPDERVYVMPPDETLGKPAVDPILLRGLKVLSELPPAAKTAA